MILSVEMLPRGFYCNLLFLHLNKLKYWSNIKTAQQLWTLLVLCCSSNMCSNISTGVFVAY